MDLWAKKNEKKEHVVVITWSHAKDWLHQGLFFLSFYIVIFISLTYLKHRLCPWCNSLGRRLRKFNRLHSYVAYGPKESRKLVLVDCNKCSFYSIIFCEALCIYEHLLYYIIDNGFLGLKGMDRKSQ